MRGTLKETAARENRGLPGFSHLMKCSKKSSSRLIKQETKTIKTDGSIIFTLVG